jgi:hypothetical protein
LGKVGEMRNSYCPVCGDESRGRTEGVPENPEAAVCSDRCAEALVALALLRARESESEVLEDRRREEWSTQQPQTPVLSELLLQRWRAGDWAVEPGRVLSRL